MRALGYPRLISMENFRKPNFELVSDILYWMVKLYDPETSISDRVEFENERVEFLTSIAALMAAKARLKLNTKKLYASDGRAVQELLKLATLLYKAVKSTDNKPEDDSVPAPVKVQDVKTSRNLASDITQGGAKLYDLLATEANDRQERSRALRFLDTAATASEGSREYQFIERSLRDIIETTKQTVEDMRKECEELEADEKNLDNKIKKKQEELERTEKRLRSLDNVRPQFMDEVDKLEKELQRHYEVYIEKYRNLDYLEHELEKYHRSEEERKEQQERRLKKMRERLLKEEVELLRGGRDQAREDDDDRGGGPGTSRAVGGNFGRNRGKDLDSSEGEGSDGEDLSGDGGGGSDDEELSVGSRGRGGGGGGGGMMKMGGGAGGPGGRGGMMMGAAAGGAGGGGGGAGRMRGGMGGSEPDSDEFLDDDDDDEEEDGDDDGGDDDSGSDEHF